MGTMILVVYQIAGKLRGCVGVAAPPCLVIDYVTFKPVGVE